MAPFPDNSLTDAANNFFGTGLGITRVGAGFPAPGASGTSLGFTSVAGTSLTQTATFTGSVGATAYTIGDVVAALKNLGLIAS